jgi:ATP-dependent Lhr-like helicase
VALSREDFDDVLGFVESGDYALAAYERRRKLFRDSEGRMHVRSKAVARQRPHEHRHLRRSAARTGTAGRERALRPIARRIEEVLLRPGDTFAFVGRSLRLLRWHETVVERTDGGGGDPIVPAYAGGRLPLTTNLAARVRGLLQAPSSWRQLPKSVQAWLRPQWMRRACLVKTICWSRRFDAATAGIWYCIEIAMRTQRSGLTKRMERAGYAPLGFVAIDYPLDVWSVEQPRAVARLFDEDMLGDDLETWLAESSMLCGTFPNVAVIAGLIERCHPHTKRTRKHVTVNADLIYDVLRRHQPDRVLLRATRSTAAGGLNNPVAHRCDAGTGQFSRPISSNTGAANDDARDSARCTIRPSTDTIDGGNARPPEADPL